MRGHTDTLSETSNLTHELDRKFELQNQQLYPNHLDKFGSILMEISSNISEQIAFNKRPKNEEQTFLLWMNLHMKKIYHELCKLITNYLR